MSTFPLSKKTPSPEIIDPIPEKLKTESELIIPGVFIKLNFLD